MGWNSLKPLKSERVGIRVTEETSWRIRLLAKNMKISRTKLIEKLVDEAWMQQVGLDELNYPD